MLIKGVFIFFATLIISFNLGTPNVTFFELTPAKWNVFSVICVAGSPKLCAAIEPTTSPAWTILFSNLDLISPRSQSNAYFENLSVIISLFDDSS